MRTWLPTSAAQAAMLTAVVVLPTPPFWFATAYTEPIGGRPYRVVQRPNLSSERSLLGHAGSARQFRRRRTALSKDVDVPVARPRVGPDPADVLAVHRHPGGHSIHLQLLLGVATALPRDQDASVDESRGRQLREGRQTPD